MGKVDVVVVFDDIKFKLGVDNNNPLPLAVKAEERGAAAMASSADRRPICIILSIARSFQLLLVQSTKYGEWMKIHLCMRRSNALESVVGVAGWWLVLCWAGASSLAEESSLKAADVCVPRAPGQLGVLSTTQPFLEQGGIFLNRAVSSRLSKSIGIQVMVFAFTDLHI